MQKPRTVFRWNTIISLVATTAMAVAVALMVASGASAALPSTCVPVYTAGCVVTSPDYTTAMQSFEKAQDGSYVGVAKELQWTAPATTTTGSQAAETALWRARSSAKLLPSLTSVDLPLAAAAVGLGWSIGRTIDTKWLHLRYRFANWGSTTGGDSSYDVMAVKWSYVPSPGEWRLMIGYRVHNVGSYTNTFGWQLSCTGSGCGSSDTQNNAIGAVVHSYVATLGGGTFTQSNSVAGDTTRVIERYVMTAPQMTAAFDVDVFRDKTGSDTAQISTSSYNPSATSQGYADQAAQDSAFIAALQADDSAPQGLNAADQALSDDAPNQLNSSGIMPDCFGLTFTACQSAIADAGLDIGQVTITEVEAPIDGAVITQPAGAIVDQSVAAGSSVTLPATLTLTENPDPLPLELPQPEPNETYTDYITRLEALGYVGTVTSIQETTALEGYGPSAPTRVIFTKPGTSITRVIDPLAWTSPLPRVYPSTDITIRYNSDTAVPVSTDGGSGGGIDFSPLQNIQGTCNFPFGVLCWAHDAISAFVAPPEAPEIDWVMPEINTPVADLPMGQHYTVGLSWLDDYMGTIRLMESFVLWFGAIWYVGSRLIGLKGGGDPSDAVDEATNGLLD